MTPKKKSKLYDVDDPSQKLPEPVRSYPRRTTYYPPWERLPEYRVKLTDKERKRIFEWEDEEEREERYDMQESVLTREARKSYSFIYDEEDVWRIDVWVEFNCNEMERLVWSHLKEEYETGEQINVSDLARFIAGRDWKRWHNRYVQAKRRLLVKLQQFLKKTA